MFSPSGVNSMTPILREVESAEMLTRRDAEFTDGILRLCPTANPLGPREMDARQRNRVEQWSLAWLITTRMLVRFQPLLLSLVVAAGKLNGRGRVANLAVVVRIHLGGGEFRLSNQSAQAYGSRNQPAVLTNLDHPFQGVATPSRVQMQQAVRLLAGPGGLCV